MLKTLALFLFTFVSLVLAAPDRISGPIDIRHTVVLHNPVHPLAQPRFDRGAVENSFAMNHLMFLVKPSAGQQAELDRLLQDQQNPSSQQFHRWLSPEEFGNRFGLSPSDHARVVAWLRSCGFTIEGSGRARNWIMFSGTAGEVRQALHTAIHRFEINGERHYANVQEPSVPAALADLAGGFVGLHDFQPEPALKRIDTRYNSGGSHYLAPADYATIYDIDPLYAAGVDGSGVNIGIVGASSLLLSDIQAFRSHYGLAPNDPRSILIGSNPGLNATYLTETDLDIEWAGAVAPGANIYYYYSTNYLTAIAAAVNSNLVQILSISYFSGSEFDISAQSYQPIFQQANAQGITVFAASGDQGAAVSPDSPTFARFGPLVQFPADLPEVTAVGGTQFSEGTGTYWANSNAGDFSSALSYIPEIAWPDSGGGASAIFSKPAWQTGPGVPNDGMRDLPDISMTASCHDGFIIVYEGALLNGVCGTSASAPAMAGVAALLNEYLVGKGQITAPGLGNLNPQLYRLAQASPAAFHDIIYGSNIVTCTQGTPGCASGTYGYMATPGYDLATGLGSLDVNNFVTQWSTSADPVTVTFTVSPAKTTLNDTLQLAATITPAGGSGKPTGAVDFTYGQTALGSAPVGTDGSVSLSVPAYQLGATGTLTLSAEYRGDAAFSAGGALAKVQLTTAPGVAAVLPSVPVSVSATIDPAGLFWEFSMSLREVGGVAAVLTGMQVDGQDVPVAQYFPTPSIAPSSTLNSRPIVYRNLTYPLTRTYRFSGVDAAGQTWTRQASIAFLAPRNTVESVIFSAVPLAMQQNPAADASCQWSQRVVLTDISGFGQTITGMVQGNVTITDQIPAIFGTPLLAPYGSLEGTICWPAALPGTTNTISLVFAAGFTQDLAVSFAGPASNAAPVSVAPQSLALTANSGASAQATVNIAVPDGQSWSIGVSPQNLVSGWLSLSQAAGSGPAQIAVQASGAGLAPGAYHAELMVQGPNLVPAVTIVPIMFVVGDTSGAIISGVTNAASGQSVAAPGMQAVLNLAGGSMTASTESYAGGIYTPGRLGGVLVTVNGVAAPVHSVSPSQIAFQIPYETGVGSAVVGVSNGTAAAGYMLQVTPSAPGIFADPSGNATPVPTVVAGRTVSLTMTGDGVPNPMLADGATPPSTGGLTYKPALPFTLTIGGAPAFLNSYGIAGGSYGVTTLNVTIPASAAPGVQPVVATVGGVSSPPVNLTITAAPH